MTSVTDYSKVIYGHAAQHPVPSEQNPVYALLQGNDLEDYPACGDLNDLVQTYYDIIILLRQAGAPASAPALSTSQVCCPAAYDYQDFAVVHFCSGAVLHITQPS